MCNYAVKALKNIVMKIVMKKILPIILIIAFGANLNAQEISDASDLKKRNPASADVSPVIDQEIKNDQEFLKVFDWLMETPIHEEEEKRQIANAAISSYIEENSNFDIELDIKLLKFAETSPELLPIFMGGYTAYMIKHNNNDPVEANVAGIESLINYYKQNEKFLEKDKNIEKFIRKAEKDKLDKYVERKSK
jgi:hypothetical protein